jgi:hypothetical protein
MGKNFKPIIAWQNPSKKPRFWFFIDNCTAKTASQESNPLSNYPDQCQQGKH